MKKSLSPAATAGAVIAAVLLIGMLGWFLFSRSAATAPVVETQPPDFAKAFIDPATGLPKAQLPGGAKGPVGYGGGPGAASPGAAPSKAPAQ